VKMKRRKEEAEEECSKAFISRRDDGEVRSFYDRRTNPRIEKISKAFWRWGLSVYRDVMGGGEWLMTPTGSAPEIMRMFSLFHDDKQSNGVTWTAFPGRNGLLAPFPLPFGSYDRMTELGDDFARWLEKANLDKQIEIVVRPDFQLSKRNPADGPTLEPDSTGDSLLRTFARGLSMWGIPTSLAKRGGEEDWLKVPIGYSTELMTVLWAWIATGLPSYKQKQVLKRGYFALLPYDKDFVLPYPITYVNGAERALQVHSLSEWLGGLPKSFDWSKYATED